MAEPKKVLGEVRELFESTHWTQGQFERYDSIDRKTSYCLVGGLREKTGNEPDQESTLELAGDSAYIQCLFAVADAINPGRSGRILKAYPDDRERMWTVEEFLTTWNDQVERKLDEVLSVLQRAEARVG